MIALPARSSWPWRPFKRPSPENGEGPGAEAGAFRASPCTVIAVPGCTVAASYPRASLCLKYPGEREGERLALEHLARVSGHHDPEQRSWEGALLGLRCKPVREALRLRFSGGAGRAERRPGCGRASWVFLTEKRLPGDAPGPRSARRSLTGKGAQLQICERRPCRPAPAYPRTAH